MEGLASIVSSPAPAPADTAVSSPAATGTDIPAERPAARIEPDATRPPSWQRELVQPPATNTVEGPPHQRGGTHTGGEGKHHPEGAYQENTDTEAHDADQTPKPKVNIAFMVLTRDQGRESIDTHWPDGSLSGKTLKGVIDEVEALVRRVKTKKLDFELKGFNTSFRFSIPADDEERFEFMRRYFNKETKKERKKGRWEFEIRLELIGGTEREDPQVENPIDEQGNLEDIF